LVLYILLVANLKKNYNETLGGAITMDGSIVNIEDTAFIGNVGNNSGAIYCINGNGNIFNSVFVSNTALLNNYGGAYYCSQDCEILFLGNKYMDNKPTWSSSKCVMN